MVVPWGDVDVSGSLREGKYLILETDKYTMNNINSASIPYITSHAITQAYVTKVEYINTYNFNHSTINNPSHTDADGVSTTRVNTYVNNESFVVTSADNKLTLTHPISSSQYTRYDVTVRIVNAAGLDDTVVFTIYPAIYADIKPGGDVFINGRFTHVQGAAGSGTGQDMPWYGHDGYNWYEDNDRNTHDNRYWSNSFYITTGYGSLRFNLGTGVNNQAITRITVTSFNEGDQTYTIHNNDNNTNETYTYKLTDPRVESTSVNSRLDNYIVTAEANRTNYNQHTADWDQKPNIMIGSPAKDAIAPDFLICSGWGRTSGEMAQQFTTFENRCATYQEAGYPAGRWRLPTEAELSFIYGLQARNVIPELFQEQNSGYWATSKRAVINYSRQTLIGNFTENPVVVQNNPRPNAGVRCIYDIWYWGEDKMSANEYHAEPRK